MQRLESKLESDYTTDSHCYIVITLCQTSFKQSLNVSCFTLVENRLGILKSQNLIFPFAGYITQTLVDGK